MNRHKTPSRRRKRAYLPLCGLLIFMLLHPAAPIALGQTDQLEPGKTVERELKGTDAHVYEIALAANHLLRVTVEQKDIDATISILAPDGKKIAEANINPQGAEIASIIADAVGIYKVGVRASNNRAPAGKYEIKAETRPAAEKDRYAVEAERAVEEAERIRKARTAESYRKAAPKYEEAIKLFEQAGDVSQQARVLKILGLLYEFIAERQKALDVYLRVLPIAKETGDAQEPAQTMSEIARVYRNLRDLEKAIDYLNQALALFRQAGNRGKASDMLNTIGMNYSDKGETQKALDYFNDALQNAEGDPSRQAVALNSLGSLFQSLGESQTALEYLNQALSLIEGRSERFTRMALLNNAGAAYLGVGEYQKALEVLAETLSIRRALGDKVGEGAALNLTGKTHLALGDYSKAREAFNQALEAYRESDFLRGQAISLNHLGRTFLATGEREKAFECLNQSLRIRLDTEDKNGEAITRYNLALAERERGNLTEAREQIATSINIIESLRSRLEVEELRASYLASFQRHYELYIDLLAQSKEETAIVEAFRINERARARTLLETLSLARADIRQGVQPDLLQRERALQEQLNAKAITLVRLLSGRHTPDQAAAARREVEETRREFQDAQSRIRQASPKYAALTQPEPLTLREIQQRVVDNGSLLLEYLLGEQRSYLWAITPTSLTFHILPRRAEIEAVALRLYESMTARNKKINFETTDERHERIAKADAAQGEAARALSEMILAPVAAQLKNKRLLIVSDGALQYIPFAALPAPRASVVSGQLSVARSKTTDNGQRTTDNLSEAHEIVSLPSASVLAVLRHELKGRSSAQKMMAVMADPVFDRNDERLKTARANRQPEKIVSQSRNRLRGSELLRAERDTGGEIELARLPFTRREAESILSFAPASASMKALDFEASRDVALSGELSKYRYVHFATHGFLNSLHPELSGVVLSLVNEEGEERDGFLRAHEVYNLNLAADLVVLSGCRTGLGRDIRGEGLVGLTRAFMYAGAARVLVSLWDISDEATAEFMARFYRNLLRAKMTPASALRAAQASMSKDKRWNPPYYWAGFILQGEPF